MESSGIECLILARKQVAGSFQPRQELIDGDTCGAKKASQSSAIQFPAIGNQERCDRPLSRQNDVAATLSHDLSAESFECPHRIAAADDRKRGALQGDLNLVGLVCWRKALLGSNLQTQGSSLADVLSCLVLPPKQQHAYPAFARNHANTSALEAQVIGGDWKKSYNTRRPHSSLDYLTP
jgi:hypothetical protein